DIEPKAFAVDRALEQPWRLDPVVTQRRQESHGLPAAMRHLANEPLATWRPTSQGGHIGSGPGLVDEDKPLRIDAFLILHPLRSPSCDVGTIPFASHHAFFEAELLGVHELPHRAVIDLQSALAELGDKPSQGEVAILGSLQEPDTVLAGNRFRFVAAHLP